ncbi:MAG TPA: energy transducer TonB [Gammaproteobacteria bacterium]|nr:energy transducer TonB [Gammaproteobacteria bacterium]
MSTSAIVRICGLALSVVGTSAQAEWRCDCTTILDTCSATVTVQNDSVSIDSDHAQCARVDYLIDGLPFVALVVDGHGQQSWLTRSANPKVLMQSCRVCLDNAGGSSPVLTPRAPTVERNVAQGVERSPEPELSRLLTVNPQYPPSAAENGVEGFVEISFTVTALGLVEQAIVTSAEPPGVFERAALAALTRWRYGAEEGRDAITLSHRFDFKSGDAALARSAPSHATAETAIDAIIARSGSLSEDTDAETGDVQPRSAVRNQCIREELSYDFGEMVEADLMNTCSEPLMVYSCAEGMGRFQRRWVCQSYEHAQRILVRPGDRLAGNVAMIEVPEGVRTFKYVDSVFVARARNTEYWWLACNVDDAECRGSGRQWTRSMDGKAASVDPQLWTQQSVARSY